MMKLFAFALMTGLLSQSASAAFISRIYKYVVDNKVVELDNIDHKAGTATYFDYDSGKKVQVNLSDASRETKEMNGIKPKMMVQVQFKEDLRTCDVYYVFENGQALVGCYSGKMIQPMFGVDPMGQPVKEIGKYIVETKEVNAEVESLDGFSKGQKVKLNIDTDGIGKGKNVVLKVIFPNGEALVQKQNPYWEINGSSLLQEGGVERVDIRDLSKI